MSGFETLVKEMKRGFKAMDEVARARTAALAAHFRQDRLGLLHTSLFKPTVDLLSRPAGKLWPEEGPESGILASASLEEGDWAMLFLLHGEGATVLWYTFPTSSGWKVRRLRLPAGEAQVAHLLALAADAADAPVLPELLRLLGLGRVASAVEAAAPHLSSLDEGEREALVRAVMLSWENPAPAAAGVCGGRGWWLADAESEGGLALYTIVDGVRLGWVWSPDQAGADALKERLLIFDAPEDAAEAPLQLCESWLRVLREAAEAAVARL